MNKRFSTFEGVFTPTLLSILGVIMYLRLGWVVGTVGLWGALAIIIGANLITIATALSMSSIVTNIRIGSGGAFSIICKSLGFEAGGAIGIPLYLSQAISVAFYIAGFSECWISVFPSHHPGLVGVVVWLGVALLSSYSAKAAFRIQYLIMAVVGFSLVSIFWGGDPTYTGHPVMWGINPSHFWPVFAVFFPAVTGVLAGASISGELIDPKKSIPRGTLAAVSVTFVIYLALAVWLAFHASAQNLVSNGSVLIDLGRWRFLVVAGIMGATLSSALSMFVGAPRTLQALSEQKLIPCSKTFSRINDRGEPMGAIMLTALIVLITLCFGSLNSVATLLTEVFLITYGMINLSVFIEQSIGIASFRPTFKIPRALSFFGSVGCFGVMVVINPAFTAIAICLIVAIYVILARRQFKSQSPDVRSGLLIFLAEQFVKAALKLPYHPKIWKPNIFFPTGNFKLLQEAIPFIRAVIAPSGRVLFLRIARIPCAGDASQQEYQRQEIEMLRQQLARIVDPLKQERLFIENTVVEAYDIFSGITTSVQLSKEMFFRPNTMFCIIEDSANHSRKIMQQAAAEGLGLMALKIHPEHLFGDEKVVNLWIRRNSPNIHLAILTALQIQKNWEGQVRLVQAVADDDEAREARQYLEALKISLRFPRETGIEILKGDFWNILMTAPRADINIFGMAEQPDVAMIHKVYSMMGSSVFFLRDSAFENAAA